MDSTNPLDETPRRSASQSEGRHEALRRSEEQFRFLIRQVSEYAIFMLDSEGRVTTWNEGAERIKGYAEEEILGCHASLFYTAEDVRAGVADETLATARREGQWTGEGWRLRKGGERFWAHVTITALRGGDGQLRGYAKVTRDMTEQRRHEKELRRSERRFRRLFEEAQDSIALTSPDGRVIDANESCSALWGYSREEILRMDPSGGYADPADYREVHRILQEEGFLRRHEVPIRRKDGEVRLIEMSMTPIYGSDGEVELYQTFARDVTEQKRAEEALRESEAMFRTLAEKALVGIGILQDGIFQYVNAAFARITGYRPEELIDRSPDELFHPADQDKVQEYVRRRLAGEVDEAHYEVRLVTKAGDVRTVEILGNRFIHRGKPAIIGMILDITERRQLQREVLRMQEEERRRLGQDLHDGVASHFFGVSMMLGAFARKVDGDDELSRQVREIRALVEEGTEDLRRLSRGLNPAGLTEGGLSSALERLAKNVKDGYFEADRDLPELDDDAAAHLYWIAQEAMANAQRYAEAGTITIRLRYKKGALVLAVEDDGRGFNASRTGSEGLGLRTMRYRAGLLGAELAIDSASGEGTRVVCRLPV